MAGAVRNRRTREIVSRVVGNDAPADVAAAVVAPGGFGKTEALDAIAFTLAQAGRAVRRVGGRRLEQGVHYAAIEEFLEVVPEPGAAGARDAAVAVLGRVSSDEAVLVVDDAQWLDRSSLRALVGVAERLAGSRAGLVVAHRPSVGDADLAALDAALSRQNPLARLGPLDEDEIGERIAARLDMAAHDSLIDAVLLRTEGVPALVDDLVDSWREAGALSGGRLEGEPPPVAGPMVEGVRARIDQLSLAEQKVTAVLSLGAPLDDDLVTTLTSVEPSDLGPCIDAIRSAGLLTPGHDDVVPVVAEVVAGLTPDSERRRLHARLAAALLERGGPAVRSAEHLTEAGATGHDAAAVLCRAGEEVLDDSPELALEWFSRAVDIGADPEAVAPARAEAAALAGRVGDAIRLADGVIGGREGSERARALAVMAGLLGSRGLWSRSAEMFAGVSGHPSGPDEMFRLLAVVGFVAIGRLDEAQEMTEAAESLERPAALVVESAALTAAGLMSAVDGDTRAGVRQLIEAAELAEAAPRTTVLPTTPHSLGALVACAAGSFEVAEGLLGRAIERDIGGPALAQHHHLLLGWVGLRTGRWARAAAALDDASGAELAQPDQLLAVAIDAGLARRYGDVARLGEAWEAARPVLLRQPTDLFSLEPLMELAVCAARLRRERDMGDKVVELEATLTRLGRAASFESGLRWQQVLLGVAADDGSRVAEATQALGAIEVESVLHEACASAAAVWTAVMGGTVEPGEVERAAEGLSDVGLGWEASRLVGQAAIRSSDNSRTRALLEQAREMKSVLPTGDTGDVPSASVLSGREAEVARYVAEGLTYKEIGAQLFISPKTVEHHVAKIRQKLGATTRAEMLAALRPLVGAR